MNKLFLNPYDQVTKNPKYLNLLDQPVMRDCQKHTKILKSIQKHTAYNIHGHTFINLPCHLLNGYTTIMVWDKKILNLDALAMKL